MKWGTAKEGYTHHVVLALVVSTTAYRSLGGVTREVRADVTTTTVAGAGSSNSFRGFPAPL